MNVVEILNLTCGTCHYMIEFQKNTQREFSSECPYRDSIESVACLKHTAIQDYKNSIETTILLNSN